MSETNVFLFVALVLAGGVLAVLALKQVRNPFRSSFAILPDQTRRAMEWVKQKSDGLPNLKGNTFHFDRTRRGDLQITHARTGYSCRLVGQHSVWYSPGGQHLTHSVATTSIDDQLVVIDTWLRELSRQVAAGAALPWWSLRALGGRP